MKFKMFENETTKCLRSETNNFNFNKVTGSMQRWGRTLEEDPKYAPFPEILDIEITEICNGPANKLCSFCSPAGTKVNTPNGDINIEEIKAGDIIWSATQLSSTKPRMRHNKVEETYTREYSGDLICIELENGKILKLTPEHPVMVKGGIEILAGDLTTEHEIIHMDDFEKCTGCNGNIDGKYRDHRYYCSKECYSTSTKNSRASTCLICGTSFIGKTKNSKFCCTDSGLMHEHRLANTWHSMLRRCYDPNRNNYKHYGGKGVTVSKEWLSFQTFISDMNSSFSEGLELERLDNTKGYGKDNCIWISKRENRQHRSQPYNSNNPYKGCSPHKGKYILSVPSYDGSSNEYIGIFETQKECVELYNIRIMEIYPQTGIKYVQEYKGEL